MGESLSISTGQLFGTTTFGDVGIVTQALDDQDGVLVSHLSAGGSIDLTNVGKLIFDGDVVCGVDMGRNVRSHFVPSMLLTIVLEAANCSSHRKRM